MYRLWLVVLLVGMCSPALAGMIGTTVQVCWNFSYSGAVTIDAASCKPGASGFTAQSAMIADPKVEFQTLDAARAADFNNTDITIQYSRFTGSSTPDLYVFSGLPGTVTNLVLLTSNPLDITTAYSGSAIGLLVNSPVCCSASTVDVTYRIEFASNATTPEPATFCLSALGLGAAGIIAHRRRRGFLTRREPPIAQ